MRTTRLRPTLTPTLTPLARAAMLAAICLAGANGAQAADANWDNGSGSFAWNASHLNWSGSAWNNSGGNGAIFGATGAGAIGLSGPVSAASLAFKANGYVLNGDPLSLIAGSSAVITAIANPPGQYSIKFPQLSGGAISTDPGVTARINSAINTSVGLLKTGGGTLELGGPLTFSGAGLPYIINGPDRLLVNDLTIYGVSQTTLGGKVTILNESVLPSTTRVGIGNGQLDLGSNNVTLGALNFINQGDRTDYDPITRASTTGSVIGTGTLRVTGEITVRGVSGGADGANTIANNLDLGGGTQIVRVSSNSQVLQNRGLQFTGVLSNGAFLKTTGLMENGVPGSPDGVSLFGNNTYTGSTTFNSGINLVTGTNASGSVKISGSMGPGGGQLILAGADGSYGAATFVQASAGGILNIDNTYNTIGYVDAPNIAAGNNGNRLNDNAEVQLRDGSFSYTGASNAASGETFGQLNVTGGHNLITLTPKGTGTVTLIAGGGLQLGNRATLQVSATDLGGTSKLYISGAAPAADSTGILRGVVGKTDFVTYNATTGLTTLAAGAYATSFAAGANVALSAASTLSASININALKRTGSFTTTIADGQTLGIASGMIMNASGTATYTGGTLAFGSAAGTFYGTSSTTVASAITGTAGLINTAGTLTLSGNLAGLSGVITNEGMGGTLNLGTDTFGGSIELRSGTLNITKSQTLAGQGAIIIGVRENDANLIGTIPLLTLTGMGANGVMARDIIVDNGGQNAAGMDYWWSAMPQIG
ncbi:MAG TPA: hypothetical protein VGE47_11500, partial [Burkholderiaceae bacterium]